MSLSSHVQLLIWIFPFLSLICTNHAIFMQCVDPGDVEAASWTQRMGTLEKEDPPLTRRVARVLGLPVLPVLKICNQIVGTRIQERWHVEAQAYLGQRWLVSTLRQILIAFELRISVLLIFIISQTWPLLGWVVVALSSGPHQMAAPTYSEVDCKDILGVMSCCGYFSELMTNSVQAWPLQLTWTPSFQQPNGEPVCIVISDNCNRLWFRDYPQKHLVFF